MPAQWRVLLQRAHALLQKARRHHIVMGGLLEIVTARERPRVYCSFSPRQYFPAAARIEVVAIPQIGLDNPPSANELTGDRAGHGTAAISLGARTRLYAAAAKVKAQLTLGRLLNLVSRSPATVLIQPNASSIR